jgi:hypothetical protein
MIITHIRDKRSCGISADNIKYKAMNIIQNYDERNLHSNLQLIRAEILKIRLAQTSCADFLKTIESYVSRINTNSGFTHGGYGDDDSCKLPPRCTIKYIDSYGELKLFSTELDHDKYIINPSNRSYDATTLMKTILGKCDQSTTEITITTQHGEVMKAHALTTFLDQVSRPSEGTPKSSGGSTRKKKGSTKKNDGHPENSKAAAPRWTSTGRKVTTKDGRSRVAFRNAAGELRVRKVTVGKDGKRTTCYITF